jgi:hypothetical protein
MVGCRRCRSPKSLLVSGETAFLDPKNPLAWSSREEIAEPAVLWKNMSWKRCSPLLMWKPMGEKTAKIEQQSLRE